MPDVKKLITGFLIVAAAASSSALILSSIGGSQATPAAPSATVAADSEPLLSGNAFQDTIASQNTTGDPSAIAATTTAAQLNDPNNLTSALADSYLNGLVSANPSGAQTDSAGNQSLTPPDNQAVLTGLAANKAVSDISIPDWDAEAADQPLVITASASQKDIANYATALNGIFNHDLVETGLQAAASSNSDASDVGYVAGKIQATLRAIVQTPAPAPAAAFQKSLVKVLVYEKNTLLLAQNSSDDPVKNSLILENEKQGYDAALQDLQSQMQKISALGLFSFGAIATAPDNTPLALLDHILGIQTAHAIFGVGDITFDPAVFAQWVLKFAEDTALQIVKNALVSLIQQKVLAWVQGSGAPRFIQNWATTLTNAYEQSALNYLNGQMQCISPAFATQIRLTLGAFYQSGGANSCAAQFQSLLGSANFQQFSNNFSNGGFLTFSQTLLPTNNFYGQLFFTAQAVSQAGQNQQLATYGQSVASQGFTGSNVCSDGSNPKGSSAACVNFNNPNDVIYPNSQGRCPDPYVLKQTANNGVCGNGQQPLIATPGTVTAQGFGVALDTSPKLVTAATTIAGLLSALTSSLLNSLAQAAISYSNQAVNGVLQSGSGGSSDGGVTGLSLPAAQGTPGQAGPGVQCAPTTQSLVLTSTTPAATAELYGQGGAIDIACATGGTCPATEGTDGSPIYSWTAPSSTSFGGGLNSSVAFNATYNLPGTYTVSVTASTDHSTANCEIDVVNGTSTTP